jgi:hypothetical protein
MIRKSGSERLKSRAGITGSASAVIDLITFLPDDLPLIISQASHGIIHLDDR